MSLNPRQARFVDEYLIDLNGKQAAIRAGYAPGQSAEVTASRLLSQAKVKAAIAEKQAQAAEKHEITRESIAEKLDIAYKAAAKFKQGGAMVQAQLGIAKLYGLITDKSQVDQTTRYVARMPDQIDDEDEWLTKHAPHAKPAGKGNGSKTVQ